MLVSAADAAAVNRVGTNTLLANGVSGHSSSMTSRLSVMVQGVYQGIRLTVLFWLAESLTVLYPLMHYLQKSHKDSQLVYQSMTNCMEN